MPLHAAKVVAGVMALGGCAPAPSHVVFGSYFPSWMLCALAGLVAAALLRVLFGVVGIDRVLPAPLVVYLALTIAFAFGTWLIWLA